MLFQNSIRPTSPSAVCSHHIKNISGPTERQHHAAAHGGAGLPYAHSLHCGALPMLCSNGGDAQHSGAGRQPKNLSRQGSLLPDPSATLTLCAPWLNAPHASSPGAISTKPHSRTANVSNLPGPGALVCTRVQERGLAASSPVAASALAEPRCTAGLSGVSRQGALLRCARLQEWVCGQLLGARCGRDHHHSSAAAHLPP